MQLPPAMQIQDAAAAILRTEDGRIVLQLRDSRPDIWYPGYWGCFGGAIRNGENALDALMRELFEELEFEPDEARFFISIHFDLSALALPTIHVGLMGGIP